MKNLFFGTKSDVEDSLLDDVVDKFGSLVQEERLFDDELKQFNLQPCEEKVYRFAIAQYDRKRN